MISAQSDRYRLLLNQFPPRPIKSEAGFWAMQAVIDRLLDRPERSEDEQDYLDLLATLVEDYEDKHVPMPDLSGVALLKALISELGLKQKDLVVVFKTESIVSAVLHGQRGLTVEHIEQLAKFFHISPAAFFSRSV